MFTDFSNVGFVPHQTLLLYAGTICYSNSCCCMGRLCTLCCLPTDWSNGRYTSCFTDIFIPTEILKNWSDNEKICKTSGQTLLAVSLKRAKEQGKNSTYPFVFLVESVNVFLPALVASIRRLYPDGGALLWSQ